MSLGTMNLPIAGMNLAMVPVPGCTFMQGDAQLDQELGTNYGERLVSVDTFAMQETALTNQQFKTYQLAEPRRYGVIGVNPENGDYHLMARGRTSNETSMDEMPLFADKPIEKGNLIKLYKGRPIEIIPANNWLDDLAESFQRPNHPVVRVSQFDIAGLATYLNIATEVLRKALGLGALRLPIKAEQERSMKGPGADDPEKAFKYGTHDGKISSDRARYYPHSNNTTGPVDEFPGIKYPQGTIFGLAGNVCEWTADRWTLTYVKSPNKNPIKNPRGPKEGRYNVIGGGSWFNDSRYLRSAFGGLDYPDDRLNYVGARFVASGLPQDKK